ncbi:MAG: ABC transporter substrate-binding protein [Gammaproteobacteria bacterium]
MYQIVSAFRQFSILLVLIVISQQVHAKGLNPDDPQDLFTDTTQKLLLELRDKSSEIKQNKKIAYDISDRLIVPYLDFPKIARLVVGKHWRRASDVQKQQLESEIRGLLIRSYVTAMSTYADQIIAQGDKIIYHPSRYKSGDKKSTIATSIQLLDGKTVDVNYKLYKSKNGWKIYDIRVAGISLAVTYRTSFSAEINQSGLDGLIARLAEQNKKGVVEFPDAAKKLADQ